MRLLWDTFEAEKEWGFLLVDARNAFNEGNRTAMLWTIRHRWPSGARFTFNCYRHWTNLVVRSDNGTSLFLHSKEGVTQGDPLAMVAYGILLLPLIQSLKEALPEVEQPWYADDAGAGGSFKGLRSFFEKLLEEGPRSGYFLEPSKCILIVRVHNKEAAEKEFKDLGFTVVTGNRYLGGFIGGADEQYDWVKDQVDDWVAAIGELSTIAKRFPQSAYAGLQKSLQMEWQFLQRVTEGLGVEFGDIEKALKTTFLPALFGDDIPDNIPEKLSILPVKKAGLALLDPVATAKSNWEASTVVCGHLVVAIRGTTGFRSADHRAIMKAGKAEYRERNQIQAQKKLDKILQELPDGRRRTITRGQKTGAWISVLPSTINGTELSSQEFRDALYMRYGITPPDLPGNCDGCEARFTLQHALGCKKGGLVISRHNEIRDELIHLAGKALTPSAIRDEPLIQSGRNAKGKSETTTKEESEKMAENDDRGDILLRGF